MNSFMNKFMLINLQILNRENNYLSKLTQAEIEYLNSLRIIKEIEYISKNSIKEKKTLWFQMVTFLSSTKCLK